MVAKRKRNETPGSRCLPDCRALLIALLGAGTVLAMAGERPLSAMAGGDITVSDESALAYTFPIPGLDADERERFATGAEEFRQRWVVLLAIGGKWGRGPTFNGEACTDCHAGNGRGRAPESEREPLASTVVRFSVPGEDEHGAPRPHPAYGDQLQNHGELGRVPPEGDATIAWREHEEKLADGTTVLLRAPQLEFANLAFGPLGEDIMTSARMAPPVIGTGLLEAIAEETILATARRQKDLGYNGRPNYVWDHGKQATVLGRFGWKANQPTLRQQIASAFLNDMGVTTSLFEHENCPALQTACRNRPTGMVPEQPDRAFNLLLFYTRALAAPARRHIDDPDTQHGERLFASAQCTVCHAPEIRIGEYDPLPRLANQVVRPYTDLLLHDMGEGLADGRPDFLAGPRDWRTSPLWGIGLSGTVNGNASLLHDGRARNLAEAILWHGGEAVASRNAFMQMSKPEREALLAFVNSL